MHTLHPYKENQVRLAKRPRRIKLVKSAGKFDLPDSDEEMSSMKYNSERYWQRNHLPGNNLYGMVHSFLRHAFFLSFSRYQLGSTPDGGVAPRLTSYRAVGWMRCQRA